MKHHLINVKNTEEFYLLEYNAVQSIENVLEEHVISIFRVRE
jgi:hypothetical protein